MLANGLRRIQTATKVEKPIVGEKIWYASGVVADGNVEAIYQKSLCLIIGPEGIMFTSSFWLPELIATRFLLPWSRFTDESIRSDRYQFRFDGVVIDLFGQRVLEAVQRYSPSIKAVQSGHAPIAK